MPFGRAHDGSANGVQLRRSSLGNVFLHRATHARRQAPDRVEDWVRLHPGALRLPRRAGHAHACLQLPPRLRLGHDVAS